LLEISTGVNCTVVAAGVYQMLVFECVMSMLLCW